MQGLTSISNKIKDKPFKYQTTTNKRKYIVVVKEELIMKQENEKGKGREKKHEINLKCSTV